MPETPKPADAQPARTEAEPAQREGTKGGTDPGILVGAGGFLGAATVAAIAAIEIAAGVRVSWLPFAILAVVFFLLALLICHLDRMPQ